MSEVLPVPLASAQSWGLVTTLAEIERVAAACAHSGYYSDVSDASQAIVKMLAGREMGIGPIQALAGIHIIEGKPAAGANLIAANVKRSGRYDYKVKERTNEKCVLLWFDGGEQVGESEFSMADAKRAGLDNRTNWKRYPRAMCFARALTEGVRVYCPDAGAGVIYTPEELRPDLEVSEDGEVVSREALSPEPASPPAAAPPPNGNRIGNRLLFAMDQRCWELGLAPDELSKPALRSIVDRLGCENTTEALSKHEASILAEIQKWEPPAEEGTV